jgi:predicted porin
VVASGVAHVKRYLLPAALFLTANAHAAELGYSGSNADSGAAPLIANILDGAEPGALTVAGITAYGVIDFNLAWQTHGVPTSPSYYQGMEYQIAKNSQGPQFAFTNNALQVSTIGLRGDESLSKVTGYSPLGGWSAIFDLQIGFNPAFAEIADDLKALRQNNGVPLQLQTANQDSNRAGQIFNGDAYGGLKNDVLGELRYGRNSTILWDAFSAYDPQKLSYSNTLLSSGTYGGGYGTTEQSRWNNSVKYKNTIGPIRIEAQYRFGSYGQGGEGVSAGAGIDVPGIFKGLSIDSVWGAETDAIAVSMLTSSTAKTPALGSCQSLGVSLFDCTQLNIFNATVSDNDAWAVMAKYNFKNLGFDDVTLYGGYEHIDYSNPSGPLDSLTIIGDYQLNPTGINYNAYVTDRQLDVFWIAGDYKVTPKLTLVSAWYHADQNSYVTTALGATKTTSCTTAGRGTLTQSNCAGSLDWVSGLIDYQWTKRLDVYAGISFTEVHDGLSSGFTYSSTINPTLGSRFRF